ncbi:OmpW family protein [Hwanghaeella grinnelliae]|uniref:OmpW family protein n=1 Tax=Hwanghaeella grinnelliae TaxID=2500179 RepID=A0A3S2Z7L6_9PROT|nr:OmpW family protein [Hwanghaeella grinnelliae]RVU36534.1 OmpW family protein [Hwanghaeella grinnelliae]
MNLLKIAVGSALVAATLMSSAAMAEGFKTKEAGDILIRARGIGVVPDESSSISVIGGEAEASNEYVPELDISYFITDNIALELIAATTDHDVNVKGSALGADVDLADVSLLPPTLTVQYHFLPKNRFSPYLGAGLNYTFFYDEKAAGGAVSSVDFENGIGYALQAGLDIAIDGNWSANLDVKKVFLNTDVKVNGGAINADVDLDPWIFGVGIGYRF